MITPSHFIRVAIIGDSKSPNLQTRVAKMKEFEHLNVTVFDNAYVRYEKEKKNSLLFRITKKIPKVSVLNWLIWRYKKLRQFSPDVTFVMYADPHSLLLTQFIKAGRIISTWGGDLLRDQGALQKSFDRWIVKRALLRADQIYCVSAQLKEEVMHITDGRLRSSPKVLHYGIDLNLYKNESNAKFESKKKDLEEPIVIFSPRWCLPVYNIEGIADAFIELSRRIDHIHLKYREVDLQKTEHAEQYHLPIESKLQSAGLESQIEQLGLQTAEECLKTYRESHIVISLAKSDGTPLSVLEAMAAGKMVVCNRVPSLEKIIDHGLNGFLVNGENPDEVAATLEQIILNYNELSPKIGKAARAYVEEFGDMNREIEEYVSSMNSMVNTK